MSQDAIIKDQVRLIETLEKIYKVDQELIRLYEERIQSLESEVETYKQISELNDEIIALQASRLEQLEDRIAQCGMLEIEWYNRYR